MRMINAAEGESSDSHFGPARFQPISYPGFSDYQVVKAGTHALQAGSVHETFTILPGKYYSIALMNGGKAALVEDALLTNPTKSQLYFYNLSDLDSASVYAPEHGLSVLENISQGSGKSRDINAITLDLQIKAAENVLQDFKQIILKRRVGHSLMLAGVHGKYVGAEIENALKQ